MTVTINISVIPLRLYKLSLPVGITATYNGYLVGGAGSSNLFAAIYGINTLVLSSAQPIAGSIVITEIQKSFYTAFDGLGGTWAYQPGIDKWVTQYSFRPEWMSSVGNRLVSFKNGMPHIHDSPTKNTFYGQEEDSVLTFVHNEAGNSIKIYNSASVEGDTPDLVHIRTEVPYVQSSDIIGSEFRIKEGVSYAAIKRDRLSPNVVGSANTKLTTGDPVRGEIGMFQAVYTEPSTSKVLKIFNIGFVPSRGHNTIPENGG